jgi:hypothetical protein
MSAMRYYLLLGAAYAPYWMRRLLPRDDRANLRALRWCHEQREPVPAAVLEHGGVRRAA